MIGGPVHRMIGGLVHRMIKGLVHRMVRAAGWLLDCLLNCASCTCVSQAAHSKVCTCCLLALQYCGSSLSRVGLDFQGLLQPMFEQCTFQIFASQLSTAVDAFNTKLEGHKVWQCAGPFAVD